MAATVYTQPKNEHDALRVLQTCYLQDNIRMHSHDLQQFVDNKSVASCVSIANISLLINRLGNWDNLFPQVVTSANDIWQCATWWNWQVCCNLVGGRGVNISCLLYFSAASCTLLPHTLVLRLLVNLMCFEKNLWKKLTVYTVGACAYKILLTGAPNFCTQ